MVMSNKDPDTLKVIDFGVSLVQNRPERGSNCFLLLNHEETYNVTALCYLLGFIELSLSYWLCFVFQAIPVSRLRRSVLQR